MDRLKHRIGIIFGRYTKKISEKNLLSKINYHNRIRGTNQCITLNRRRLPLSSLGFHMRGNGNIWVDKITYQNGKSKIKWQNYNSNIWVGKICGKMELQLEKLVLKNSTGWERRRGVWGLCKIRIRLKNPSKRNDNDTNCTTFFLSYKTQFWLDRGLYRKTLMRW